MDRERSYYALYRGDIVKALQENNINRYIKGVYYEIWFSLSL